MTAGGGQEDDRGVGDALRDAIEKTLQSTAGSAALTRERAGELVDEVAARARDARDELTRRSQLTGADLARRGQGAGAELGRRLESLERRLAELEANLRREARAGGEAAQTKPKAES